MSFPGNQKPVICIALWALYATLQKYHYDKIIQNLKVTWKCNKLCRNIITYRYYFYIAKLKSIRLTHWYTLCFISVTDFINIMLEQLNKILKLWNAYFYFLGRHWACSAINPIIWLAYRWDATLQYSILRYEGNLQTHLALWEYCNIVTIELLSWKESDSLTNINYRVNSREKLIFKSIDLWRIRWILFLSLTVH